MRSSARISPLTSSDLSCTYVNDEAGTTSSCVYGANGGLKTQLSTQDSQHRCPVRRRAARHALTVADHLGHHQRPGHVATLQVHPLSEHHEVSRDGRGAADASSGSAALPLDVTNRADRTRAVASVGDQQLICSYGNQASRCVYSLCAASSRVRN